MTVCYAIDAALKLIYFAGFGYCSGQDLFQAEKSASENILRQPNMSIIIDIRSVQELDFDQSALRQAIALNERRVQAGQELERTAIVARNSSDFHLFDAYKILSEPKVELLMKVFLEIDKALDWLGLSEHKDEIERIRQTLSEC